MIIISHRLSWLVNADAILVLERGRVYDIGTHEHARPLRHLQRALAQQHRHLITRPSTHEIIPFPTRRSNAGPENLVRLFQSETQEISILLSRSACARRSRPRRVHRHAVAVAAFTRLDRVVFSTGQIVTVQSTMIIQALDPSIIKTIDVRRVAVKAGDVLATLDPTFASADVSALKSQVASPTRRSRARRNSPASPPMSRRPATTRPRRNGRVAEILLRAAQAQFDAQSRAYDEQLAQLKTTIAKPENDQARYGDRAKLARKSRTCGRRWRRRVGAVSLLAATDTKTELLRYAEMRATA